MMGLPRFVGQLQHYSISTTLGHKSTHRNENSGDDTVPLKFVIDGPALAYHIYYRLSHRSNALEALPSYGQIGQATIAFLSELEAHHVQMIGTQYHVLSCR